jgi:hypothetical protein
VTMRVNQSTILSAGIIHNSNISSLSLAKLAYLSERNW